MFIRDGRMLLPFIKEIVLLDKNVRNTVNSSMLSYFVAAVVVNIFFLLFTSFYSLSNERLRVMEQMNKHNITPLEKCENLLCNHFQTGNISYIVTEEGSYTITDKNPTVLFQKDNILLWGDFTLGFEFLYKNTPVKVSLPLPDIVKYSMAFMILLWLVGSYIFIIAVYKILLRSKLYNIVSETGQKATLINKNMAMITENIHHEAKTPLSAMVSEIEYIRAKLDSLVCSSCIKGGGDRTEEAFNMIDNHIAVIYDLLEKMRDFKNIRYSNGNLSAYDVLSNSFKTMKIYSKISFITSIDEDFKGYKFTEVTNETILMIMINHIKNSLEANATKIFLTYGGYSKGLMTLYLTDNGNGIPEHVQDRIFDLRFSTKSGESGEVRGTGLYTSKKMLENSGGTECVVETSKCGTVFKFVIPVSVKRSSSISDNNITKE